MNSLYVRLIGIAALIISLCANAQNGDLNLNGMAAFEQLRKEYYIGALYLGWPGHDPAAIAAMPGKKRMEIHITADRWPALRFAQMWNQAITINNPSQLINANALDILAFTSLPKGDLLEGDRIVIELTGNNTTQVSVNGLSALHTSSSALFNMLLNAWVGQRPPTSEFKRDILDLPKDQAGKDLEARYENMRPNDVRKKTIAGWGFKAEPEPAAAAATAIAATATATAVPPAAPAPAARPEASKPPVETKPVTEATKPVAETKPAAPPKSTEAKPSTTAPVAMMETPKPAAPTAPASSVAPPEPAPKTSSEEQQTLYNEYVANVRGKVLRKIEYPRRAVKDNIEGLVMLRIKVDHGGSLVAAEIAQSADDLLDSEALSAVKKAAPFAKAPDALEGNNFELIVPVVFKLQ